MRWSQVTATERWWRNWEIRLGGWSSVGGRFLIFCTIWMCCCFLVAWKQTSPVDFVLIETECQLISHSRPRCSQQMFACAVDFGLSSSARKLASLFTGHSGMIKPLQCSPESRWDFQKMQTYLATGVRPHTVWKRLWLWQFSFTI